MRVSQRSLALLGLLAFGLGAVMPALAAGPTVLGAGASFPQLEIEQWRADVARKPYEISVNYQSSGSTFGRQQYIGNRVDFGVSDIAFQPDELINLGNRRPYAYVPVSAGGVGFMYNLKDTSGRRITNLKLTPRTVCRLFTERMSWNDPEIVADNPGVSLRDQPVVPVLRSDGAGTGFVLNEYCIATAPDVWARFVDLVKGNPTLEANADEPFKAGKPSSKWPHFAGRAEFASDGVANAVASDVGGDGGITYVEAGFAKVRGFPVASVRNAAGTFAQPTAANVSRALAYATSAPDGTLTLAYSAPQADVYFPSAYSYVIAQTEGFDPAKGAVLGTFLNYAVTKGQERAEPLGYARLSSVIVNAALDNIRRIPGAPPRPTNINAPPPPPIAAAPGGGSSPGAAGATSSAQGQKGSSSAGRAGRGSGGAAGTPGANGDDQSQAGSLPDQAVETPGAQAEGSAQSGETGGEGLATATPATPTGRQTLWNLLLGAGLCALGMALTRDARNRFEG